MSNKPTHKIVTPIEQKNGKTYWQHIGSAWQGEKGLNCKINALPLGGEFVIFPNTEKVEGEEAQADTQDQE